MLYLMPQNILRHDLGHEVGHDLRHDLGHEVRHDPKHKYIFYKFILFTAESLGQFDSQLRLQFDY